MNNAVLSVFANNKRICKNSVCPLMDDIQIEKAIKIIQENYKEIEPEWVKGDDREHVNLKKRVNG